MAVRLFVIHLPSPSQTAWQIAVVEAASRAGWDVFSLVPDQEPVFRDGVNALIQGVDASLIPHAATDAVILAGSPQVAVDTLMQMHDLDQGAALTSVGWWFAQAAEAAARNAVVVNAASEALDLPGLGRIVRGEAGSLTTTSHGAPLAFYETLPPAIGASAFWPIDILLWIGGTEPGFTDLTGKRRLLQHGPYLLMSAGTWTAEIVFELAIDRALTQLRFDWGDGVDVTETSQRLSTAGVYSVALEKSWDQPTRAELRIWLDRSMFDGSLRIRSTKVTRTG